MASRHQRPQALDRKYTFEYEVGQWTLGSLSVIRDKAAGALWNCKTVPKAELRTREDVLAKLKALRDLRHTHICGVADVIEDQNNYYIISEFCPGGEVSDWIARLDEGYWLQEQTCITYVRHTLLALCHSHAHRVFHRDLNPSSMQLTSKMPDANVKIIDVGLAAILDPDCTLVQRRPSAYTAPEVLGSVAPIVDGSADMYSLGAVACALLTGRPPVRTETPSWLSRTPSKSSTTVDDESWADRSQQARDFVQWLLRPAAHERPTAARALQHPWLKGGALNGVEWHADDQVAREVRHKTLCYMLSVLLIPVLVPFRDFEQLRVAFQRGDSDSDGIITRRVGQRILLNRCALREAVDAALDIVDIGKSEVLDLCATACADLIAREFFGAGPSSQPLQGPFGPTDLATRLLKRFFEVYGDRRSPAVSAANVRARLRTATARDIEVHAGVRYDEILGDFPENASIDSQALTSQLSAARGRGTPLAGIEEPSGGAAGSGSPWGGSALGLMNIFHNCSIGSARREESPHTIDILVR